MLWPVELNVLKLAMYTSYRAYFETRTGLGLGLGLGPEENPDSGKTQTGARTRV